LTSWKYTIYFSRVVCEFAETKGLVLLTSGLRIYSQKYCFIIPFLEIILVANLHVRVNEDESAPGEVPHLIGQIDEGGVVEGWIGLLHTLIN
jgi:hypothetical protein